MLGGGIEVPCIYRFYGLKESKVEFRNKLSKQIDITDNKFVLLYLVVVFLHLDSKRDGEKVGVGGREGVFKLGNKEIKNCMGL